MNLGTAKSGHIFFLPLRWDILTGSDYFDSGRIKHDKPLSNRLSMAEASMIVLKSDKWELMPNVIDGEGMGCNSLPSIQDNCYTFEGTYREPNNEFVRLYNEHYFFYKPVRDAIYNIRNNTNLAVRVADKAPCADKAWREHIQAYKPCILVFEHKAKNIRYLIQKGERKYELEVDSIQLRLYESGIMLLSLSCLNRDESTTLDDVGKINCLGRRLYTGYFLDKPNQKDVKQHEIVRGHETPDELALILDGKRIEIIGKREIAVPEKYGFVETLFGEHFISDTNLPNRDIRDLSARYLVFDACNDERMFVQSFCADDAFKERMKEIYPMRSELLDPQSPPEKKAKIRAEMQKWYAMIYADNGINEGACTCRDDEMLLRDIEAHTDPRWLGYGTLYGVTRSTMLMLTSTDIYENESYLAYNFMWHYFQLSVQAVVMRMSMLRFYDEASGLARRSRRMQLTSDIRRAYLNFLNRQYFREVTAQEQGIELFDLLCSSMRIDEDMKFLDAAFDELHGFENNEQGKWLNYLVIVLTIITIVHPLLSTWFDAVLGCDAKMWIISLCTVIPLLSFLYWFCKTRNV